MGQQTQNSGRSTLMNPSSVPPVEVDYIVCGLCQRDFPLANIVSFMQHKKFDCDDFRDYQGFRSRILLCKSCPRKFNTPWRLLQHAQSVHSLHIFFEQAEFITPPGFSSESLPTTGPDLESRENHFLSSENLGNTLLNKTSLDLHSYSLTVPPQGKGSIFLHKISPDNSVTDPVKANNVQLNDGNGDEQEQLISAISVREIVPSVNQEVLEETSAVNASSTELTNTTNTAIQVQGQTSKTVTVSSDSPVVQAGSNKPDSKGIGEEISENDKCCDNQDCGITLMPGTHEEPKKCCNAVVPKKRKRHMQTKHMSTAGRLSRRRTSGTADKYKARTQTVFIDIDQSMDSLDCSSPNKPLCHQQKGSIEEYPETAIQHIAGEVEINSHGKTHSSSLSPDGGRMVDINTPVKKEVQSKVLNKACDPPASQQRTCIIEPGTTFSIPMAGNIDLASVFSNLVPQPLSSEIHNNNLTMVTTEHKHGNKVAEAGNGELEHSADPAPTVQGDAGSTQFVDISKLVIGGDGSVVSFPEGNGGIILQRGSEVMEKPRGLPPKTLSFGERRRRYPTSKPFKCEECNQAFNQRIHLKKHQSKHTGIKPFQCNECDYSTVEKSHLKVHIRVHTGEKPFKCTYCEYATAQNSTLKIHLKRHLQGTAGLRCLQCRKEFAEPERLTTHSRTEHQPYRQVIMPDGQLSPSPLPMQHEAVNTADNEAVIEGANSSIVSECQASTDQENSTKNTIGTEKEVETFETDNVNI